MNTESSSRQLGARAQSGRPDQHGGQGDCGIAPMGRPAAARSFVDVSRPDRSAVASRTDIRSRVWSKTSGRGFVVLLFLALLFKFGTTFLVVALVIVAGFTGIAWRQAYLQTRAHRQWLADRAKYRARTY